MNKSMTPIAVIAGITLIISSAIISRLFINVKKEKEMYIRVKGYAAMDIKSDIATLSFSHSSKHAKQADAYIQQKKQSEIILRYLSKNSFDTKEIDTSMITITKVFKRKRDTGYSNWYTTTEIDYFVASQNFELTSTDVYKIQIISRSLAVLNKQDITISVNSPDYMVTDLKQIKFDVLSEATTNGYKRATLLADNSGGKVGTLISAQQGIFQITGPNSTETSGSGYYETTSIDKTIKAVVNLEYKIN
ncbi:MAG: SIMPL domain-containing protein [Lentisphaeria bacterium]|nr:SIMPL domain-containing protein [Lentisphaeria bacterium]NQZ70432.1 SIMPL domain-containing protein [Lentisphaeria bacterium]